MKDVIICAECGTPIDMESPTFQNTVNLTPDAFFIEDTGNWPVDLTFVETDISFDWCGIPCLGRWIYRAAALTGATPRPPGAP